MSRVRKKKAPEKKKKEDKNEGVAVRDERRV